MTQPDRLAGRGLKPVASPIKARAAELGLPVYQPERIRDEQAEAHIRATNPDLMVVVAYGQILPARLLEAPRLGTVNVHASLLPRHRGAAPIEWAILSGDSETGVTIMQMDAGVDTGPILAQERISIGPRETARSLEAQLATRGGSLLASTIGGLEHGRVNPRPQSETDATPAPRVSSQDGMLDPATMSADVIDRKVRALAERVGTWLTIKDVEVKVLRGHPDGAAGDGVPIETRDGTYIVDEVQPPSGRRMSAAAWLRGRR